MQLEPLPADGGGAAVVPLLLRPIRADDFGRLRAFARHLSRRSGYQRLLSPRMPTEDELRRWTAIDASREAALVAVLPHEGDERIIGVTRYVREGDTANAEFAIILADAWQGHGLGPLLLRALVDTARRDGVRRLYGTALSTNTASLTLARRVGFRVRRSPESATLSVVEMDLDLLRA